MESCVEGQTGIICGWSYHLDVPKALSSNTLRRKDGCIKITRVWGWVWIVVVGLVVVQASGMGAGYNGV